VNTFAINIIIANAFSLGGELVAELPFTLMHPKPEEDRPSSSSGSHKSEASAKENGEEKTASAEGGSKVKTEPLVDTNLIQLDTDTTTCYADQDDDIIFEDFARLRFEGETEA
jgi:beta-arrestin